MVEMLENIRIIFFVLEEIFKEIDVYILLFNCIS